MNSNNNFSNGGFPPLKLKEFKEDKQNKVLKKERHYKSTIKDLNIKNILSQSIVKPMIDLNKSKEDRVIDSL
jgi:hypothetical protein